MVGEHLLQLRRRHKKFKLKKVNGIFLYQPQGVSRDSTDRVDSTSTSVMSNTRQYVSKNICKPGHIWKRTAIHKDLVQSLP